MLETKAEIIYYDTTDIYEFIVSIKIQKSAFRKMRIIWYFSTT